MQLGQLFQERLLKLEYRGHCDEDDHDLTALEASADEYMAQPSGAGSLVESLNFEAAQHIADIDDDAVGDLILYHAFIHRYYAVASGLVYTGYDMALPVEAEGGAHLVAIVRRVVHADDIVHMAELAQKAHELPLLMQQLLGIWEILKLTSAAFAEIRARSHIFIRHKNAP